MAQFKEGDTVYFSSIGNLVNDGIVECVEGPYVKIASRVPGVDYMMASHVFSTKTELMNSREYHSAWMQQQSLRRIVSGNLGMTAMSMF